MRGRRELLDLPELEDSALVDQVAKGQYAALEVIYDRYANLVYSLAMRVLGEPEGAREVVQDTFVRVWEESAGFGSDRAFDVWLLNRARQVAIEHLRQRRARPQRDGHLGVEGTADDAGASGLIDLQAGIERDPRATAYHRRIREVLQGLSKEQRRTIELSYFQGYTQEEISRLTDEPLSTIKDRLRAGLRRLHDVARAEDMRVEDPMAAGILIPGASTAGTLDEDARIPGLVAMNASDEHMRAESARAEGQ